MSRENAGKKKVAIAWDNRCQQSFDDLKHLCTMAHILAYADFTKPFMLHTNGLEVWPRGCPLPDS